MSFASLSGMMKAQRGEISNVKSRRAPAPRRSPRLVEFAVRAKRCRKGISLFGNLLCSGLVLVDDQKLNSAGLFISQILITMCRKEK
jgi:hypothetical protein